MPTPASVFGFEPGADNKLATYDQVVDYFRKVAAAASDNVKVVEAGKTSQGRTAYFALVSSKENLRKVDRYREIARRLAHPEGLTDAEAKKLAAEGRAFVHIDGGLHSTEYAGPQHTSLLLYDLLRRQDEPEFKAIFDNVILMLWPTINPDGHQLTTEAYMRDGSGYQGLYQEYVGHDNNRDAYMLNMIESRMLEFTWRQWEPSIIYVHHQSSPFPTRIWLPPFAEPIAQEAPGLMSSELNMIGMAIAQRLDQEGKVGATHMGSGFDAWYPGYVDYQPVFKNIPAFWTETQGTGPAPRTSTPDQVPANMRRAQALYPSPWLGGTWRLRDAVEYMETASIATLDYAAKFKDQVLYNRYQSGRDQIARGRREAPYAYVFPQTQRDPVLAVELLRRLAFSGIRVYQLSAATTIDGASYAAGTWVIPTDQEFAASAREVLDVQKYPDLREFPGGPPDQPYDAAGWTLPLSMGVTMTRAATPLSDSARANLKLVGPAPAPSVTPMTYVSSSVPDAAAFDSVPGLGFDASAAAKAIVPPGGRVSGTGSGLAVNPAQLNAFRAVNRAWKAGLDVQYAAGSGPDSARYVINGLSEGDQKTLIDSLALIAERVSPAGTPMKKVRVGLFKAGTGSMDEGWTRWVLEQYGFEYVSVSGLDIQAAPLASLVDALIIPDEANGIFEGGGRGRGAGAAGGGAGAAAGGAPAGAGGAAPVAGGAAPAAGGAPANAGGAATGRGAGQGGGRGGGAGAAGAPGAGNEANNARLVALEAFIRGGGTLVCFNRSSNFAITQLKLPIRNATQGLSRQEFFANGSLIKVTVDTRHRVMAGMAADSTVFFDGGPVFEPLEGFTGTVLARYADAPLASGYLLGEKYLAGKAAALDVPIGSGHVVLLGFRPQWRGQPFNTFRVIFNAAWYGH